MTSRVFFFQAEDGIRDGRVTGIQTCALPISPRSQPATTTNASGVATGTLASTLAESKTITATINAVAITQTATVVVNAGAVRSEERRVGKEGRARGAG